MVLGAIGFTGAGITASSLAAKMMSASAIANGGGVAAGSLVATLQSVGRCPLARLTVPGQEDKSLRGSSPDLSPSDHPGGLGNRGYCGGGGRSGPQGLLRGSGVSDSLFCPIELPLPAHRSLLTFCFSPRSGWTLSDVQTHCGLCWVCPYGLYGIELCVTSAAEQRTRRGPPTSLMQWRPVLGRSCA